MIEKADKKIIIDYYKQAGVFGVLMMPSSYVLRVLLGNFRVFNVLFNKTSFASLLFVCFPLFVYFSYLGVTYMKVKYYLYDKYYDRVHEFYKTKDPLTINPFLLEEDD